MSLNDTNRIQHAVFVVVLIILCKRWWWRWALTSRGYRRKLACSFCIVFLAQRIGQQRIRGEGGRRDGRGERGGGGGGEGRGGFKLHWSDLLREKMFKRSFFNIIMHLQLFLRPFSFLSNDFSCLLIPPHSFSWLLMTSHAFYFLLIPSHYFLFLLMRSNSTSHSFLFLISSYFFLFLSFCLIPFNSSSFSAYSSFSYHHSFFAILF